MIQLPAFDSGAADDPERPNRLQRGDPSSASGIDIAAVLEKLRQTKASMQRLNDRLSEPLAIIGLGCRFPGASSPDEFWNLLDSGRSADTVAGDRWDSQLTADREKQPGRITANRTGWIADVDRFDAAFFGISGREAATLDPQQRLLLEVAWETFEQAGISPRSVRGRRVGAFVGICSNDYLHRLTRRDSKSIDTYLSTGNAHGTAAGRLSYLMDWRGPSVAVDTACSSSLTALHLAGRSLRYGDCDTAIAMGVNVILAPELSISLSQAGMLSPTGRCHAFSADADGFVRGEGCGAVLMKRYSDAVRDGDTIHALVRGSATNQDGHSIGLTAPNGNAQQAVIRAAMNDARVLPEQIDYLETHGTGTPLGDPIEIDALRQVFAEHRISARPLRIGSVKTNVGHLEGAAGIAGVIKVVLSMKHRRLPMHLNCDRLSESIDWNWPVEVNRERYHWASPDLRIAGISSFGFGGSNAHVVLSDAPQQHPLSPSARRKGTITGRAVSIQQDGESEHHELSFETDDVATPSPALFALSAKSATALRQYADKYVGMLEQQSVSLVDLCYSAATTRETFDHRFATVVSSVAELLQQLRRFVADGLLIRSGGESAFGGERYLGHPKVTSLHKAAAAFLRGESVDWAQYFGCESDASNGDGETTQQPVARRIELPTYPFQRTRRWFDDSSMKLPRNASSFDSADSGKSSTSPASMTSPTSVQKRFAWINRPFDTAGDEIVFECDFGDSQFLQDHVVGGSVILPAAGFIEVVLQAARRVDKAFNCIENLCINRPIFFTTDPLPRVQVIVLPPDSEGCESRRCRIAVRENETWRVAAQCHITKIEVNPRELPVTEEQLRELPFVTSREHYAAMETVGLTYGKAFQGLLRRGVRQPDRKSLKMLGSGWGIAAIPNGLDADAYQFHPAWMDACFQAAAGIVPDVSRGWVPVSVNEFVLCRFAEANQSVSIHATLGDASNDESLEFDFVIADQQGTPIATVTKMRLRPITRKGIDADICVAASSSQFQSVSPECERDETETLADNMDASPLRGLLHHRIAEIMGLGLDEVPMNQSLDALGLDSLMAFELRDELQQTHGIEVPLEIFFETITLDVFLERVIDQIATTVRPAASQDGWVEGVL